MTQKSQHPVLLHLSRHWVLYLCLLAIVLPPLLAPIGAFFYYNPVTRMQLYVDGLVLIALFAFLWKANGEIRLPSWKPILFLSLICIWATISLGWAVNFGEGFVELLPWLISMVFMLVIYNTVKTESDLKIFLIAVLLVCGIVSGIGVLQSTIGFDKIPQTFVPGSTFGNRNMGAQFILFGLPIAVYLTRTETRLGFRLIFLLLGVLILAYQYYAGTRSVALAMAVQMCLLLPWLFLGHSRKSRIKFFIVSGIAVFLTVVSIFAVFYRDRLESQSIQGVEMSLGTLNTRMPAWLNTLPLIEDHILVGTGIGNWKVTFPKYSQRILSDGLIAVDFRLDQLHNEYLQLVSELGLIGGILFLILVFFFCRDVIRYLISEDRRDKSLQYLTIVCVIAGLSLTSFFSFPWHMPMHTLLTVTFLGLMSRFHQSKEPRTINIKKGLSRLLGIAIVLPLVLLSSWFHYNQIQAEEWMQRSIFQETQSVEMALRYAKKAQRLNPWNFQAQMKIGYAQTNLGDFNQAERSLLAFLERYPYSLSGMALLSQAYISVNQFGKAALWYEKMLEIKPSSLIARRNIGILYLYRLNRPEEGIEYLKEVLSYDPDDKSLMELVENYKRVGNFDEARQILLYLSERFPDNETYRDALNDL